MDTGFTMRKEEDARMGKIVVIVPSYNPDEKLLETLHSVIGEGFSSIIVVNDGSYKECQKQFDEVQKLQQCTLLTHAVNQGKGRALKTAFNHYLSCYDLSKYVGVLTIDADGQHLAKDVSACAKELQSNPKRLVLGCRNFTLPKVPPKSQFGNQITSAVFRYLLGVKISDTQTGLRGLPNEFVKTCLTIMGERFEYETRMLLQAKREELPFGEVEIETVYFEGNRETHFHAIWDSLKIYWVILGDFLRFTFSGLSSFAIDQGLFRLFYLFFPLFFAESAALFASVLLARAISSVYNYLFNQKLVFRAKSKQHALHRYYILCALQALLSYGLIYLIGLYWHEYAGNIKLLVDVLLFFVSYRIQAAWVFKKKKI